MSNHSRRRACFTLFLIASSAAALPAQEDWRDIAGFDVATYNGAAMAPDRFGRIVRFGGNLLQAGLVPQDVTQIWDGQAWTTVTGLTTAPSARAEALMAFDVGRQRTVVFGGVGPNNTFLDDTWEWDGATWTQVFPTVSPTARRWSAMAYDGQRVIMFGGRDPVTFVDFVETWAFDGVTWSLLNPTTQPPEVTSHALAGGPGEILYAGGGVSAGGATWRWDGTDWTQLTTLVSPGWRAVPALTYDPVNDRYLLYGGLRLTVLRDTWQFAAGQWSEVPTARTPRSTVGQSNAFHALSGRWLVTASAGSPSPYNTSVTSEFGADLAYVYGYGVGCSPTTSGSLTIELLAGQPRPGNAITFGVGQIAGLGLFAVGFSDTVAPFGALPLPLSAIGGSPNCTLWHSADFVEVLAGPTTTLQIPFDPMLVGLEFYAQGFDLVQANPGTWRVTRGFRCGIDWN